MRGGLGGALSAWLFLIALRAVGTAGGSGRIAEAFADVQGLVERVLDPSVPAIPDQRSTAAPAAAPMPTAAPAAPPRLPVPAPAGGFSRAGLTP